MWSQFCLAVCLAVRHTGGLYNKKAMLSQRWPHDAPNIWVKLHALTVDIVLNPNTNPILNRTANPIPNPNLNRYYVLMVLYPVLGRVVR